MNGISFEQHIINIFNEKNSMEDFLDKAYQFIKEHHEEIVIKCG